MIDATVVAAVVTLVTALAHSAGGGAFPPPLLLAAAALWSLWCAFLVGGARARLHRTVLGVALSQPAMHLVFSVGGHETVQVAGHAHDAAGTLATIASPASLGTAHGHGSMLLAHVVAGLVSVLALRWGARVVRRAIGAGRRLVRRMRVAPLLPVAVDAPVAPPADAPLVTPPSLLALAATPHRGPPLRSFAS